MPDFILLKFNSKCTQVHFEHGDLFLQSVISEYYSIIAVHLSVIPDY